MGVSVLGTGARDRRGGIIVAAFAGIAGLLIAAVGDLSVGEVFTYIGLPAFVVAVLVGAVLAARRLSRAIVEARIWQQAVSTKVLTMHEQLHQYMLRDVLHEASVEGWEIESDQDGITFTSPDGDVGYVDQTMTDPYEVAEYLNNVDPNHFPEHWAPAELRALVDVDIRVKKLEKESGVLEALRSSEWQ